MPDTIVETPAVESAPQPAEAFGWLDTYGLEEVETVETPLPDAASSAVVETPKQAVPTDVPAKVEPATPTGTEEAPAAVSTEKPAEAAAPTAEAKPDTTDDPELNAEENDLVRTRPAAERPALTGKLKKASFISKYLDPELPATGTVEELRKMSPSSYARLETAVIVQRLAEPATFLDEVFARSPETYGRLLADGFQADPGYFIKQITGKDGLTAEQVRTAVEFYEHNKDRVVEQPTVRELSAEELADVRLYLGDEAAATIEALQQRAKEVAPASAPVTSAEPQPAKADDAKPDLAKPESKPPATRLTPEEQQARQAQIEQTWDEASGQIETYLDTWADDPRDGLGLKVTPQERELAPVVADLKDYKRRVLFDGLGDLPDFRAGLTAWGKDRPEFVKALKHAIHFANLGEKANAIEAARALLPFVEKYKQERMQAPIFARIDSQIAAATSRTNPKPENDAIIPGAVGSRSPQPTSDPNKRIDDLLLSDAQTG